MLTVSYTWSLVYMDFLASLPLQISGGDLDPMKHILAEVSLHP